MPTTMTRLAHAELVTQAGAFAGHPEYHLSADKVKKAQTCVEEGRVRVTRTGFEVDGDLHAGVRQLYTLSGKGCNCEAGERSTGRPYPCFHLLAADLHAAVAGVMKQAGEPMFADSLGGREAPAAAPAEESVPTPATPDAEVEAQKYQIMRQLTLLGWKPKTRAEVEDLCLTQTGLPLEATHYALMIERLEELRQAREQAAAQAKILEGQAARNAAPPVLPPKAFINVSGKPHVTYKGLLAYAHERGLVQLEAALLVHTPDLAIAKAVARFDDGRVFTEYGDATPGNVTAQIKPHFMRMALTRAKGRALRDALNIGEAIAEETGQEEEWPKDKASA